jgi:hypothetical protein
MTPGQFVLNQAQVVDAINCMFLASFAAPASHKVDRRTANKVREPTMRTDPTKAVRPTASNLVVALFTDSQSANGAVADLKDAGFSNGQISIAFSNAGKQARRGKAGVHSPGEHAVSGKGNSLAWRLRRSFEHDLHRSGTDQMAGQDENLSSNEPEQPYSEVDLRETLLSIGVAEDRILLLDHEITEKGTLILVNAADRSKDAESIMERNSGKIRTDTATERAPLAV